MSPTKRKILFTGLILLIIGSVIGIKILAGKLNKDSSATAISQENNSIVVEVKEFAKNPYFYLGKGYNQKVCK